MRRRLGLTAVATALLGSVAIGPVHGEQPIDATLRAGHTAGQVVLAVGDLKGEPLPEVATAAFRFLVQWHKGDPAVQHVPLLLHGARSTVQALTLGLPISGLTILRQGQRGARIRVGTCPLDGLTGVDCPMTLRLARLSDTATWHVLAVSVP